MVILFSYVLCGLSRNNILFRNNASRGGGDLFAKIEFKVGAHSRIYGIARLRVLSTQSKLINNSMVN